ncbi:MAG TPA: hypothetical protein VMV89_01050, partial [Candidatus Paceibacterota bacterium]|nr:hypothetical protein [Candidatus Paceibacterota bacterium]
MSASLIFYLANWRYVLTSPLTLIIAVFVIWMFVHAVRNGEWLWAVFIFIGLFITAVFYYFMVYRAA